MGSKRGIPNGRQGESSRANRPGEGIFGHFWPRVELYCFLDGRATSVAVPVPWRGKDWFARCVCPRVCPTPRSYLHDRDGGNWRQRSRNADARNLVGGQK